MKKRAISSSGFLNLRTLIGLFLCAATACFILIPIRSGLPFLRPPAPSNASQRTLTYAYTHAETHTYTKSPSAATSQANAAIEEE